jgi:hypothetical protein
MIISQLLDPLLVVIDQFSQSQILSSLIDSTFGNGIGLHRGHFSPSCLLNFHCFFSEFERVDSLLNLGGSRCDTHDYTCPRVARQGALQDLGQGRVTVRDMPSYPLRQNMDDLGEVKETLVDAEPLLHPRGLATSFSSVVVGDLLRSSQVDKVEIAVNLHHLSIVILGVSCEVEAEKRVRPTGTMVVECLRILPIGLSELDQRKHLLDGGDLNLIGAVNHKLLALVLVYGQHILMDPLLVVIKQVINVFVVYLDVGQLDKELIIISLNATNPIEKILHGEDEYSRILVGIVEVLRLPQLVEGATPIAHHGIGLSGTCLAIHEDCAVEPV